MYSIQSYTKEVNIFYQHQPLTCILTFYDYNSLKKGVENSLGYTNFYFNVYDDIYRSVYPLNNQNDFLTFLSKNNNYSMYIFLNYNQNDIALDYQKHMFNLQHKELKNKVEYLEQRVIKLEQENNNYKAQLNRIEYKLNSLSAQQNTLCRSSTECDSKKCCSHSENNVSGTSTNSFNEKVIGFTIEPSNMKLSSSKIVNSIMKVNINIQNMTSTLWNYEYALELTSTNNHITMKKTPFIGKLQSGEFKSIPLTFTFSAVAKKGGKFPVKFFVTYKNQVMYQEVDFEFEIEHQEKIINIFDQNGFLRKDIDLDKLPKINQPVPDEDEHLEKVQQYYDDFEEDKLRQIIRYYAKTKELKDNNMDNLLSVIGNLGC